METIKLDPALRKKKSIIYTVAEIVGVLALTILGNCWDWLKFSFDFSNIKTWAYWSSVIVQAAMYSIALVLGYLAKLEKLVMTDEEFARDMAMYHDRWKLKDEMFPVWVDGTLNPRTRVEFYREHIRDRLGRMDRFARDIDKNQYIKWLDSKMSIDEYEFKDKRAKRYSEKRFGMEQLITPEHIEKNAQSFSRYPRIHAYSFTWGVRDSSGRSSEYKVNNTVSLDMSMIMLRKFLSVIISAIFVGSIFMDPDSAQLGSDVLSWLAIIVKYLIRCALIVICLSQGLFLAKRIFDNDYIGVIENRTNFLNEFIAWDSKNGKDNDPLHKVMAYLQSQQDQRDSGGSDDWISQGNK
jgi:hypothetical protein